MKGAADVAYVMTYDGPGIHDAIGVATTQCQLAFVDHAVHDLENVTPGSVLLSAVVHVFFQQNPMVLLRKTHDASRLGALSLTMNVVSFRQLSVCTIRIFEMLVGRLL